METFIKAPGRFKFTRTLLVVAAAVAALTFVLLATGSGHAQTPRHATPEACPGETSRPNDEAAAVVDSGHYALFDVYWNPDEGELTNTVCPPSVKYFPSQTAVPSTGPGDPGKTAVPARVDRTPSAINIIAEPPTIIHIPSSAKVDLTDSTTYGNRTYAQMYPQVLAADNKEDRPNAQGTPVPGMGDGIVWALPACPPKGDPSEGGLCLSFSAALLKDADWTGDIKFHVDHVHQTDIDKQDPRYVLAYDVPAAGATVADAPLWNSSDATAATVTVAPGEYPRGYRNPLWFFTDRGTYEFQVHIQGNPDKTEASDRPDGLEPVSKDASVTSDVREYIVHVGAEADLGVTVMVTPESPSPTNEVTITITASNAVGNDAAPETKVDVTLPDGLTYSTHTAATETTYDSATGVWTWDEDEDNSLGSGSSETLTITATVDAGTHGQDLTVEATISATEPVNITEPKKDADGNVVVDTAGNVVEVEKTYHVPVPDPDPDNNMDEGTITVASSANVNPMFHIVRSVKENSPAETPVGTAVAVKEPDAGDTLTFSLAGIGASNFTATSVAEGAQITVAEGAHLNYEHKQSYDLVLTVSDGKDLNGHADSAIDDSIPMSISLVDVDEPVNATVGATLSNGTVTWTFTVTNPPTGATNAYYRFGLRSTTTGLLTSGFRRSDSLLESFTFDESFSYRPDTYRVEGSIQYDEGGTTHYVHADVSGSQLPITIQ